MINNEGMLLRRDYNRFPSLLKLPNNEKALPPICWHHLICQLPCSKNFSLFWIFSRYAFSYLTCTGRWRSFTIVLLSMQERNKGGQRGAILWAANHCGEHRKAPTMSQVLSSIQYICFWKTPGSNRGVPNLLLFPRHHLTSLRPGSMQYDIWMTKVWTLLGRKCNCVFQCSALI